MKIAAVNAHVLRCDVESPFQSAFHTFHDRWACLVEVICDNGLTGWGECLGPSMANGAVVEEMGKRLIGRDPLMIEPIWLDLYHAFRDQGQRGLTLAAQSGIDIALWDIAGKHYGAPVHALLGGAHRMSVMAYATGGFRPVGRDRKEALVEELTGYADAGFRAAKIKVGYGVDDDEAVIRALRAALPADMALMIDANHGYDVVEAVELGRRVADQRIGWFEEPVTPEHLNAYREVRERQPLPVAGGETWSGRAAFSEALAARTVDILQPDVCGCGGITEMRKIIAMAETTGVRVTPHVWGTGVAMAASLQMIAATPPMPPRHADDPILFEFDQTPHSFRQEVIRTPFVQLNGAVAIPDGLGLGVEVLSEVVAEWRVPRSP